MEYLQLAITGLSVVAAILAWIAKLRWSQEYTAAKEATIAAKDAQIQVLEKQIEDLRDLTPMKLREYVLSIKLQLEEYNDSLLSQVEKLKTEIAEKNAQISRLNEEGTQKRNEIAEIKIEKEELNHNVALLVKKIDELELFKQQIEDTSQSIDNLVQYDFDLKAVSELILAQVDPYHLFQKHIKPIDEPGSDEKDK